MPDGGECWPCGSDLAQHSGAQNVQPDRADVERPAVEGLEVERVALPGPGVVAQLQPEPFADLVRRRLPGPAEVAVELEAQEALGHVRVPAQEGPGLVVGPVAAAHLARGGEAAVDADVEDDPGRPERLP